MKKRGTEHVVIGDKGRLACMHCGGQYTPDSAPTPVNILTAIWDAFAKEHGGCKKPKGDRCATCLEMGHTSATHVHRDYQAWMRSGDTGTSSKAIWHRMMGHSMVSDTDTPWDPSDFGRCHRLLTAFPEWRKRIGEMAPVSPRWASIVASWDELEALYVEELKNASGNAPKLYARMKQLRGGT